MTAVSRRRSLALVLLALVVIAVLALAAIIALNLRGEDAIPQSPRAMDATPATIERGRYLALTGNCAGCHTTRGGQAYSGGGAIETPFGTVRASNLTPDKQHGIGEWTSDHFWRAMHNGRSKDGRLLYPAFPYPSFTHVSREDSDAIFAFLRSLPPAAIPNLSHELRFPYNTQAALAVWRAFSFTPGSRRTDEARSAEWNRGAYLVEGLGHCIACHGSRNVFGATQEKLGLSGGLIPIENWYAPSLASPREAGVSDWQTEHVVQLFKTGTSPAAVVTGPMADVVYRSTQYWTEDDLRAMATYLQQLPGTVQQTQDVLPAPKGSVVARRDTGVMERGARLYDQNCAYCHGATGEGEKDAFPPLAGNRAVLMDNPINLIQIVRRGGFAPATTGNPRPFGMPPFGGVLDDAEVAAVLTYVRGSWGNDAAAIGPKAALSR